MKRQVPRWNGRLPFWSIIYPKYQEDIQQQLDQVFGGRNPSLDDRPNLPLVHATIIETLRVGNVAPLALPHLTLKDTTLCGYRVPKDTIVFADTESVHLDPKCWENPTVFNPYRHSDENSNLITNQGNFYPFGAGRCFCAGEPLGKVKLFLFLSWMLQKFAFMAEKEGHPSWGGGFSTPPPIILQKNFFNWKITVLLLS